MAPDPQTDRLRLVIESEDEEARETRPGDDSQGARNRTDEVIDLDRLADEVEYEFEDETEPPRRSRVLPTGLAVIALMGFGAVAWYAYEGGIGMPGPESIPLIVADAGPIKTKPTVPGGLEVPHQDKLVLNEITPDPNKPQVERLLPPPEVPKPPAVAAPAPAQDDPGAQAVASAEPAPNPTPGATRPETTAAAPVPAAKAEGAPAESPASEPTPPKAPEPLATASGPAAPKAAQPPSAAPAETAVSPPAPPKVAAAPQSTAKTPPQATSQATQSAAGTGGYLIQLASLKDKNLAGPEWVRLQKAFPELLGSKRLVLQSADLGSRGIFHRIRAGYFDSRAGAVALCQALKAKRQDCIVVKP